MGAAGLVPVAVGVVSMKSGLVGRNNKKNAKGQVDEIVTVSMKSGLVGRNNCTTTTPSTRGRCVSMKSDLVGRNNQRRRERKGRIECLSQ